MSTKAVDKYNVVQWGRSKIWSISNPWFSYIIYFICQPFLQKIVLIPLVFGVKRDVVHCNVKGNIKNFNHNIPEIAHRFLSVQFLCTTKQKSESKQVSPMNNDHCLSFRQETVVSFPQMIQLIKKSLFIFLEKPANIVIYLVLGMW